MRAPRIQFVSLAKLILLGALAAILLWQFDLHELARYVTLDKFASAIAIQPIVLVGFGLAALRLRLLVGRRASLPTAFKAVVLASGVNVVMPGRLSEILKATYLRDHAEIRLGVSVAAIFLERMTDVLLLGTVALVSILAALTATATPLVLMAALALTVLFALPLLAPIALRLVSRISSERLQAFISRFIQHAAEQITNRVFFVTLGITTLMWLTSFAAMAILLDMTASIPLGLDGALVIYLASTVGGAVPALPGGFGTYEAAVVFVLRGYGYQLDEALALALMLHATQIVFVCVAAPLIALGEPTGIRSLIRGAVTELRSSRDSTRLVD